MKCTLTCNYCGRDIDRSQVYVLTVGNVYHRDCEDALQFTTPRVYTEIDNSEMPFEDGVKE